MRDSLAARLGIAESIADAQETSPGDRMRALDFLAKYGLGPRNTTQKHEVTGKGGEALAPQVWVVGGKELRF